MSIKQVIVARTDLNMRKGKLAAQVAHAAMKVFFDCGEVGYTWRTGECGVLFTSEDDPRNPGELAMLISLTPEMAAWAGGTFTKIVLGVETEADLLKVHELALAAGLPTALVTDMGATEFHGVPTHTTVAIGPAEAENIDKITGPNGVVKTKLL